MPNVDVVANVIVLVAAGLGAIIAVVCAERLVKLRRERNDNSGWPGAKAGR